MERVEPPMNADQRRLALDTITEKAIGCAFRVSNGLGSGYPEKCYENALAYELRKLGLEVEQQYAVQVFYEDQVVGDFVADILIENRVLVELKVARALDDIHVAQCLNYLKATGLTICLLMNFGTPKIQIRRLVRGF